MKSHLKSIHILSNCLFLCVLIIMGCQNAGEESTKSNVRSNLYAKNFSIEAFSDYKVLTVSNGWEGSTENFQYILYKNEKPKGFPKATFIKLPVQRVACMSSTHTVFLKNILAEKAIVAVSSGLYDKDLQNKVTEGTIKSLGDGININYELLIDAEPDVVFTFGVSDGSSVRKIKSLGLTPVIISEFRETHPLAKAEWEKFFAAFFEADFLADRDFSILVKQYDYVKDIAAKAKKRPTVFTGVPFQGIWYVPSGSSTVAQYIEDAGGDYLWKDKKGTMSLELGFEVVFDKAENAGKWLDVGYVFSKKEVAAQDSRFQNFKAFQSGEMYNYTKRVSEQGIFDYYESATSRPDIILKDFVKALHPDLMPNHDFYYYEKME